MTRSAVERLAGRPPLPTSKRKNDVVKFPATGAERQRYEVAAAVAGISVSELARRTLNAATLSASASGPAEPAAAVVVVDEASRVELVEARRQVRAVGSNLNTLLKDAHLMKLKLLNAINQQRFRAIERQIAEALHGLDRALRLYQRSR